MRRHCQWSINARVGITPGIKEQPQQPPLHRYPEHGIVLGASVIVMAVVSGIYYHDH